jgi:hypothetical protein
MRLTVAPGNRSSSNQQSSIDSNGAGDAHGGRCLLVDWEICQTSLAQLPCPFVLQARDLNRSRMRLPISKFLSLFVLITIAAPAVFAAEVIGAAAGSASQSQALGSVKDYVIGDPYAVGENEDQVPALRIEVANGESKLTRGPTFRPATCKKWPTRWSS